MGMAASQARYLSLVARQSNCEYEGQQINQARTALANQSANLFNQMLGLQVPVPPSTQDFTKTQYSFTDGINASVIDKWEQLAKPWDSDENGNYYNYVVEYHYDASVYKGFQKKMNDPQVQFSTSVPTETEDYQQALYLAQKALAKAQNNFDEAYNKWQSDKESAKSLSTYRDRNDSVVGGGNAKHTDYDEDAGTYKIYNKDNPTTTDAPVAIFKAYDKLSAADQAAVDVILKTWAAEGISIDKSQIHVQVNATTGAYDASAGKIALRDDLQELAGVTSASLSTTLPIYHVGTETVSTGTDYQTIYGMKALLAQDEETAKTKQNLLEQAKNDYESINRPDTLGNTELTPLEIDADGNMKNKEDMAELTQIIADMNKNGVDISNILNCFSDSLSIDAEHYTGGLYSFVRDGVKYFTTYKDLEDTARSGHGINNIDQQDKLNYYHANYVTEPIHQVDKAMLDTDSEGRFKTVKFKSDGAEYTLNFETVTDDVAYQDAMNQYYYKNAQYDKMIQDLNAKTSIIQQEDRTLELRLKQLDTEHNALKSEIEAVSKVINDNVDKSFKTFSS